MSYLNRESRVPSEWELNNLHVIELTGPHWDPWSLEMPIWPTNEVREMKSIRSLRNRRLVHLLHCASLFWNKFPLSTVN